ELYWVEKMIEKTGNPLEKIKLRPEEVPELSQRISNFQDEPFGGIPTLAYSKIFEKASEQGIKVLLDGQGMDEQWAGYDYYTGATNALIQGSNDESPFRGGVLNESFKKLSERPEYPKPFNSELQNIQYRDLFFTKMPRALRFNDRISMSASTELREPFLDYRLVELAFNLPESMKIRGSIHKYLLREIVREYVPFEIAEAPKRALQTPQREWLGNELKVFAENSFQKLENSEMAGWFDFDKVSEEWQLYIKGEKKHSFFIWQWINAALLSGNCQ
ncbi:MAG: asparagine synthase C-terminal domain-containing protein, partial [Flavobacteriaceae bacterium]|nr:asparagine synthase C-terminal domain-containing protein [Flavobacteriaceae bacterium]